MRQTSRRGLGQGLAPSSAANPKSDKQVVSASSVLGGSKQYTWLSKTLQIPLGVEAHADREKAVAHE
ncbi:hypothetical protein STIAU_2392 [Stigmatella aurantiaca DW4/3-1]|uniref:Uncharacterized protein n=1 Tax=Stigmatella aurantiaca (strain DW4/3-1) TaxID=378806 RepID=Q08MM2_STIAD|nr:hypothetical protein STIAU_2392 [Stigmatella aurantiaca DW4/3-1]